jgi:CRISPR/Cas system-associated protein Cas10 (large subunit of type III CRISPR-Cas system)
MCQHPPTMDLEEKSLGDTLEQTCSVCGARLTEQEIEAAREAGGPFLCSVHAAEVEPAEELAAEDAGDDAY